jgi:uncharacterized glyoxalase superfamily protein PhnB
MDANYKPAAHPAVTPYLVVEHADEVLKFAKEVLGAVELRMSRDAQGSVVHAELAIGDGVVMLGQSSSQWPPSPAALYVYVPDVDTTYRRAIAFGLQSIWEPVSQPYGDRNCGVKDRSGVQWWLATHCEDVSEEETERRAAGKTTA